MLIRSSSTAPIPAVSVPTYVFGSATADLPDTPVIIDPERPRDRFLSLATYSSWSQRFAKGLLEHGFKKEDRVLLVSMNSIAWPVAYMGTIMAGGVLTGVASPIPHEGLLRVAKDLKPRLILAAGDDYQNAERVAVELGLDKNSLLLFESESLFEAQEDSPRRLWSELFSEQDADGFDWDKYCTSSDQLAVINYTHGTTDFPKGVMCTHRNIVASSVQSIQQQKSAPLAPERGFDECYVMWMPLYHAVGQNQACVMAPKRGIRVYLMATLALADLLKNIAKYRPRQIHVASPVLQAMSYGSERRLHELNSLKAILTCGAPLQLRDIKKLQCLLNIEDCCVMQSWVMTEMTSVVASRHPLDRATSVGVGELLPNVEAKILAADGTEVDEPNTPGEIWVCAPNVARGYWRDEAHTKWAFGGDGWLRTGDFGHFDEWHHLYVSDRAQDVVYPADAPAGAVVLPTDLETELLEITGVMDAGVTRISRDSARGFVVLNTRHVSLKSIRRFFEMGKEPWQQLSGGLYELGTIPKLPGGQVDRAALRAIKVDV